MRCAIKIDEEKSLYKQKVSAWGELQSLNEEPGYKEEDIKSEADKKFFEGYKFAFDEVDSILKNAIEEDTISEDEADDIRTSMSGSLCMMLFSILDEQEE